MKKKIFLESELLKKKPEKDTFQRFQCQKLSEISTSQETILEKNIFCFQSVNEQKFKNDEQETNTPDFQKRIKNKKTNTKSEYKNKEQLQQFSKTTEYLKQFPQTNLIEFVQKQQEMKKAASQYVKQQLP